MANILGLRPCVLNSLEAGMGDPERIIIDEATELLRVPEVIELHRLC